MSYSPGPYPVYQPYPPAPQPGAHQGYPATPGAGMAVYQPVPYAGQPYPGQPYPAFVDLAPGSYVPSAEERSQASTCHYLGLLIGWIAPLIYWGQDRSPFVRYHARQAMNVSLTYLIISTIVCAVGIPILMLLAIVTFGLGALLMIFLPLIAIYPFIAHIMSGSRAGNGEWAPSWAIQFLK